MERVVAHPLGFGFLDFLVLVPVVLGLLVGVLLEVRLLAGLLLALEEEDQTVIDRDGQFFGVGDPGLRKAVGIVLHQF